MQLDADQGVHPFSNGRIMTLNSCLLGVACFIDHNSATGYLADFREHSLQILLLDRVL